MTLMAKNTTNTTDPATPKGYAVVDGQEQAPAVAAPESKIRVRITARCTAAGCVLAPGARILLPLSKAESLVALKKAIILGV